METSLSIAAILVALSSLIVAVLSYLRVRRMQTYDYSPRLQIENEKVIIGSPSKQFFNYSCSVKNKGQKPVRIDWVWMHYGPSSAEHTGQKFQLLSGFTLSPDEERQVEFSEDNVAIKRIMEELSISECLFKLIIEYRDFANKPKQAIRRLGGYALINGELGISFVSKHEMLT